MRWLRGLLIAAGYGALGALGVFGVLAGGGAPAVLIGGLLALIGTGGLGVVAFALWRGRYRLEPGVGIAPSGAPATFFRRSRFMIVWRLLFGYALAALALVGTGMLYRWGYFGWALLVGLIGLLVLYPVVVMVTGPIRPGGLWLTPSGVEYREPAVSWAVSWSELVAVRPGTAPTCSADRPAKSAWLYCYTQADNAVVLVLNTGVRPVVSRRMRWGGEIPGDGALYIDSYQLAGDAPMITKMIGRCLAHPTLREELDDTRALRGYLVR